MDVTPHPNQPGDLKSPVDPLEIRESEGGALGPSQTKETTLARIFQEVKPPEVEGIDLHGRSPQEIVNLLPPYGGKNPVHAILIDNRTGGAFAIRGG